MKCACDLAKTSATCAEHWISIRITISNLAIRLTIFKLNAAVAPETLKILKMLDRVATTDQTDQSSYGKLQKPRLTEACCLLDTALSWKHRATYYACRQKAKLQDPTLHSSIAHLQKNTVSVYCIACRAMIV